MIKSHSPGANKIRLKRPPVEVLDRHAFQIDIFQAANIDGRRRLSLGIDAFSEGVHPANRAKAVLDDVFIEGIGGQILFGAEQFHPVPRNKPHQGSLANTDGTIAGHGPRDFSLDLEDDFAAVAAALVFHGVTPFMQVAVSSQAFLF